MVEIKKRALSDLKVVSQPTIIGVGLSTKLSPLSPYKSYSSKSIPFLANPAVCQSRTFRRTFFLSSASLDMATTASASLSCMMATTTLPSRAQKRENKVVSIGGLNSYGGLKAYNKLVGLGLPVCTEQSFANIVSSLKRPSGGGRRGGGALFSTCNAAGEIFRIAAIMNGLVLIGVAVGFVLLRIEASLEESD